MSSHFLSSCWLCVGKNLLYCGWLIKIYLFLYWLVNLIQSSHLKGNKIYSAWMVRIYATPTLCMYYLYTPPAKTKYYVLKSQSPWVCRQNDGPKPILHGLFFNMLSQCCPLTGWIGLITASFYKKQLRWMWALTSILDSDIRIPYSFHI